MAFEMIRQHPILGLSVGLLAFLLQTQDAIGQESAWSGSVSLLKYWPPDDDSFSSPVVTADRGRLHLEARYNYENLDTTSLWLGYNCSFGESITVALTPMISGVFGQTSGIAPGYHLTVNWKSFELYSEGEYVFDLEHRSDSYFYNWSELSWAPVDWMWVGLVAQRTRVYESGRDIQRGLLLGTALGAVSLAGYVFNPGQDDSTYVLSIGVEF